VELRTPDIPLISRVRRFGAKKAISATSVIAPSVIKERNMGSRRCSKRDKLLATSFISRGWNLERTTEITHPHRNALENDLLSLAQFAYNRFLADLCQGLQYPDISRALDAFFHLLPP
jgi:hypothetical protein